MKTKRETMEVDGVKTWRCAKCGAFKPADGFHMTTRRNGMQYPMSYCKACSAERSRGAMKAWREARRDERIADGFYVGPGRPRGSRNRSG